MGTEDSSRPEGDKQENAATILGMPIRFTEDKIGDDGPDEIILVDPFVLRGLTCEIKWPDGTLTKHPATFRMK